MRDADSRLADVDVITSIVIPELTSLNPLHFVQSLAKSTDDEDSISRKLQICGSLKLKLENRAYTEVDSLDLS